MPPNVKCEIGKSGHLHSCSSLINDYKSFHKKCSIFTCDKTHTHYHHLCVSCEKLFNERKQKLIIG